MLVPALLAAACQTKTVIVAPAVTVPRLQENEVITTTPPPPTEPVALHVNLHTEPPQVDPGLCTDVVSFMVVERTLDPATGSSYAFVLYAIQGAYKVNTGEATDVGTVGVEALDDWTISFALRRPAGYLPAILSLPVARPVPKWASEEHGVRWIEPGLIVTNGPYLMHDWVHQDSTTFVKNPHHFDADRIQIERVEAVMIPEASTAFAMYEANELETVSPPFADMDRIRSDPVLSQELTIYAVPCTAYLGFTNNKPPLHSALVRRAFSAAIDRANLIENVTKAEEIPANTFAPQGIFGSVAGDPAIAPWALDPELGKKEAQKWLAEAGCPGGAGFPPVTLMCTDTEENIAIAEAVQSMWRTTLGVEVDTITQEWGVDLNTLQTDTPLPDMPHIFALGWCADYANQSNWVHDVLNNQYGMNRLRRGCLDDTCTQVEALEFDRLTEQAGAEPDPVVRKELYRPAEKALSEPPAARHWRCSPT